MSTLNDFLDDEDRLLPPRERGCISCSLRLPIRSLGMCGRCYRAQRPACNQPNCEMPTHTRGMCSTHAKRVRLYGDPHATPRFTKDHSVRFWAAVEVGHPAGCWWWSGKRNRGGYGHFRVGSGTAKSEKTHLAHRYAYEHLVGPIPDGKQLDHLCRNRACVNPDHLEPVTPTENSRRAAAAKKTHCKYNHRYVPENVYRQPSTGRRSCLTCRRIRSSGGRPAISTGPVSAPIGAAA